MPELPEVETIARKLQPVLVGRAIEVVDVLWTRTVACPQVHVFCDTLTGAMPLSVGRRAKFIRIALNTGHTLLVHLRMTGKFAVGEASMAVGAEKHIRLRFRLDDGRWIYYIDPRKFGRFYLVEDPTEILGDLGPEPLDPAFTAKIFFERLSGRRGEIKRLLLNQHFIAGLGNIYVSEALWRAHVHPQRVAGSLTLDEASHLHTAIIEVLQQGIENGGTSLQDRQYVYPDGALGRHQYALQVYDRDGEYCPRCGYAIVRIVQGQRSTYFCPVCQRLPD